ncbi:putative ClpXP protease specificity-enhancing factor [Candidatus Tremblaya phenacola PAVE]|nr:putative ClpXP protease specificity-enhancing factor [Candidatus Tremblaya phenacola PAVE]
MLKNFGFEMMLIFSVFKWCSDNSRTPCICFERGGKRIVLNISRTAVRNLIIGCYSLSFIASIKGRLCAFFIRISEVTSVYCIETGEGLLLAQSPTFSFKGHLEGAPNIFLDLEV